MTDEQKQSIFDAACRAAERFGVPVVILAAILWMGREAASSLHETVLVPIIRSHTEFLEETRRTQKQQSEILQEIAIGQREIQHTLNGGAK